MDINYEELFGLEPEDPAGEEEQEIAEPAEIEEDLGEEEQEIAEPAGDDAGEEDDAAGGDPVEAPAKNKPQTPEERRAQAAARRQREQQDAIDAALRAERERNQAEWDAHYRAMNIRDPYHGNRPVTTRAEYEEYVAARDEKSLERDLKSGRMTTEQFREQVNQQAQRQAREQAEQMRQLDAGRAEVQRQFEALQRAEPSIKSLDEVMSDPVFVSAFAATKDMTRAYRMAHVDEIEARARGAAQAGQSGGKDHLRRAGTRGGGAPTITQDIIDSYRLFDPNVTVEEIRQYEAKYQKTKKK